MNSKGKLWSGDFVIILGVVLLAFISCQGLNNGTPIYVELLGGSNAFAGMLILEFSAAAAVVRVLIGRIIDKRKRRDFIITGAVLLLIGTAGALPFPYLESQVVFRAIQGVGFGAITTAASTATADVAPAARLGEALGYSGLGQSLGFAVGPSLSIVLVSFAWHETLFAGMAVVAICLIVLGVACRYESHPERLDPTSAYVTSLRKAEQDARTSSGNAGSKEIEGGATGATGVTAAKDAADATGASDAGNTTGTEDAASDAAPAEESRSFLWRIFEKGALPGAVPMLVSCLGYAIIVSFVSKYGVHQGLMAPGVFFVFAAITMTAVRLFGGRLIDRFAPLPLLVAPTACGVICCALLAMTQGELWFYVAGAFFGLSMGLAFPLFNTVAVRCAPTERRGAASALYGLSNDLGIGIGAVIWGAVIDALGYTVSFWGGAAMLVCAFAVAALVFPRNETE